MKIIKAEIADAADILALQKLSYQSEAEIYNDYDIPPLKQTVDEIKEQFKNHIFLKAVHDGEIIGAVRAYEESGTCHVGRLAVHPDHQNKGIGTALMNKIERYFKPERFELLVGAKSSKNIRLYKKLGYSIYDTSKFGHGDIEVFYMEKTVNYRKEDIS